MLYSIYLVRLTMIVYFVFLCACLLINVSVQSLTSILLSKQLELSPKPKDLRLLNPIQLAKNNPNVIISFRQALLSIVRYLHATSTFLFEEVAVLLSHLDIIVTKSSNKYLLSCGPGLASGWYCTAKAFLSFIRMPSTVLSFKLMCVISALPVLLSGSIAKP